jgi:hypothetical protein
MALDINLKGRQFQEFQEALQHAFPRYNDLEIMLMHKLGVALPDISPPLYPQPKVTYDLIAWAKATDRLSALLAGALEANPDNPYLKRVSLAIAVSSDEPPDGRLEARVLQGIPFVDKPEAGVTLWRQKMHQAERCVCRVEIPLEVARGTGFLVGRDIVMTNWHVAKLVKEQGLKPEAVAVRFDYKADTLGELESGETYALAQDWLLDSSPEKELDYALVRLAGMAGDSRGTLVPKSYDFLPNYPLFILQHPEGAPLNVQVGTIVSINSLHKRVNYTTNTAAGSSGSPCFSVSWELVALHHFGQRTSNMGIPLNDIMDHLKQSKPPVALELGW